MVNKLIRALGLDPVQKELDRLALVVEDINALEPAFEALSDAELKAKTAEFRARFEQGETLDDLMVEAFAAVREASKRTIGLRHYDVQMIGGAILHQGKIAEMRTGEGKTLVATLPVYLNALTSKGVHLITVNDYLARRDARWMAPIYHALGLSVGVLQMASRTENGSKAFVVDLEATSPHEDQNQLRLVNRSEAYAADITYGTNSEFGFDYLRDNLTMRLEDRVQRGHYFAIVDEVDNILIDEARTPLIISGPASDDTEWYVRMSQVVRALEPEDYEINEKDNQVSLTEVGEAHVESLLQTSIRDPDRPEDITPEQARLLGHLEQALRAHHLYRRNKHYLVQAGKVVIIDEFTGRLMPGRRWSEGLHQAVEAKEGVKVEPENVTYATITIQNYFRMYEKLAGMTGTALTESEEFYKIYKLEVIPLPMNLEFIASRKGSPLVLVEKKDDKGYPIAFYTQRDDPLKKPVFWKRQDYPDLVYQTEEAKLRAITLEIIIQTVRGRPLLVGTTSVEHSDLLSERLAAEPVRRLLQAQLLRGLWLEQHNDSGERRIPELDFLNQPLASLQPTELRQVGKSVGLTSLNLEEPDNLSRLLSILELDEQFADRLVAVIQGGVAHSVLNARKHDEEGMIIARAGAFGAVTIATNMAGRGVDIKLGGDLRDDIFQGVVKVLSKAGHDPYNMKYPDMEAALKAIPAEEYGIYEEQVVGFFQFMEEMDRVRELGGLHVIGSERHEARRIDNQLRGRSARQGDPGSSRFFLSLEDDLMRLFASQQVQGLMQRLSLDPSMPIESGMLGNLVKQAQERVEGANFDVRKHLLEYDDVLNAQRKRIYGERNSVFAKDDLESDVLEILLTELKVRIPAALKDEEGPWKLIGFLDEIQQPLLLGDRVVPSYSVHCAVMELRGNLPANPTPKDAIPAALTVARAALSAENDHLIRSARSLLDNSEAGYQQALAERMDALDAFLEGQGEPEEGTPVRRPQEVLDELNGLMRIPIRLNGEQLRQLAQGDREVRAVIKQQLEVTLLNLTLNRVVGALERRLGETLNLRQGQFQSLEWNSISTELMSVVEQLLEKRVETLLAPQGTLAQNAKAVVDRLGETVLADAGMADLLINMVVGQRLTIDPRTKQKAMRRVALLSYIFLAARQLEDMDPKDVTEDVLDHLNSVQRDLLERWGESRFEEMRQQGVTVGELDEALVPRLEKELTHDRLLEIVDLPLAELQGEDKAGVSRALGRAVQTDIYRHVLLSVISELWVEYLTKVEALRVSIGLEAYAQRDPLVQYKARASEMFSQLLSDIRMGVISRMFLYQPQQRAAASPAEVRAGKSEDQPAPGGDSKKKRRRH